MNCFKLEYKVFENKDSVLLVAGEYLENKLCHEVYRHWEGTPWDFSGYTNTPQKGVIACGYFVSTTLKHTGLNLNRYKMAQQSALSEVKTLDKNHKYYTGDLEGFIKYAEKNLNDGLYIIGLSNHVGYLHIKKCEMNFIHSNYYDPGNGVTKERVEDSQALLFNTDFVVGEISGNKNLIKKFLFNEKVNVVLD